MVTQAAKQLHFNKNGEAMKRMQAGVDKLATVVGVTLGPKVSVLYLALSAYAWLFQISPARAVCGLAARAYCVGLACYLLVCCRYMRLLLDLNGTLIWRLAALQGRNVVLESKYGSPRIVNDGVTVAKEVELEDPVENIGARLVRQASGLSQVQVSYHVWPWIQFHVPFKQQQQQSEPSWLAPYPDWTNAVSAACSVNSPCTAGTSWCTTSLLLAEHARHYSQAAAKTNDTAGDGTTTATILSAAIIAEGMKIVAAGTNPIQLARGIEKTVAALVKELQKLSVEVTDDDLANVATVSAGNNEVVRFACSHRFLPCASAVV